MPLYKNDYIGLPGEITITVSFKNGKLHGYIRKSSLFYDEELYNIKSNEKKFTANFTYLHALGRVEAELLFARSDDWMFGYLDLGAKLVAEDYMKVYIKRQ